MQVCFIFLLNFNDFNEICTPNQRVPPLIIFKDWAGTFQATQADPEMYQKGSGVRSGPMWVGIDHLECWAVTFQATQADPEMDSKSERCQIWTNVTWNWPSGVLSGHFPSHQTNSRNGLQKGAVPDLDQSDLELTIWSIERALSKLPNQFQTDSCWTWNLWK